MVWMVTSAEKPAKWLIIKRAVIEKPNNGWRLNFIRLHKFTWATYPPSFVQFWEGHLRNLGELIRNYPNAVMCCVMKMFVKLKEQKGQQKFL